MPRRSTSMPAEGTLEQAAQAPRRGRERQFDLPARGCPFERVDHADQPGLGFGAGEAVLHGLGHAARAGEEVGDRGLARVEDDLPGGGGDGGVGGRRFGRHAAVDLRAGVRVDVEARAPGVGGQGVRAARHGLGLEGRGGPAGRHLRADHAAHVALQRHALDLRADEHLDDRLRRGQADRGARVVVGQDLLVGGAVPRRSRALRPGSCRRRGLRPPLRSRAPARPARRMPEGSEREPRRASRARPEQPRQKSDSVARARLPGSPEGGGRLRSSGASDS